MAEVLLVIWTQWSRKPSDREISVSVRERANGKRQRENEKRAALPGLRLEMEPCERIASPALSLIPPALSEEPVGLCFCRTHPRAARWFSANGGLSRSRPPGPIAGTILAQRAELGSALRRLVHVSAHCWLGRARDRAACCLPTWCFPWKSKPEDLTHVQGLGAVCSALWCQRVRDVLQGRACVPSPYSTPPCHISSSDVFPFFF